MYNNWYLLSSVVTFFLSMYTCGFIVTGANYLPPPKGLPCLSPQKEPRSRYRYLDSDGALLKTPVWPLPSETKAWCLSLFCSTFYISQ